MGEMRARAKDGRGGPGKGSDVLRRDIGVEGEKGERRGFAAGNGLWARGEICRRMEGGGGIKGIGVKGNGGMGDR